MSDTVVVVTPTPTQTIVVGQQGPAGPPGAAGGGHTHTQVTASVTWIINHNLGRRVNAVALDSGHNSLIASYTQPTTNQVIFYFDFPQSGFAIIS